MVACIYEIKNKVNGKCYVGSTYSMTERKKKHLYQLRTKTHSNPYLQNAYNKHGEENFEFSILEEFPNYTKDKNLELLEAEDKWMEIKKVLNKEYGYNIETARRTTLSEETKAKISASLTGFKWTEEMRIKNRNSFSKKTTFEDAEVIRMLAEDGVDRDKICEMYDISARTYYYIIKNEQHINFDKLKENNKI